MIHLTHPRDLPSRGNSHKRKRLGELRLLEEKLIESMHLVGMIQVMLADSHDVHDDPELQAIWDNSSKSVQALANFRVNRSLTERTTNTK